MGVDKESSVLQTITTHIGVYRVTRLMFGIKTAPNAWQRFMDQILNGLEGVVCFFDDITIQDRTQSELLSRLRNVLKLLKNNNLHLNDNKCQFFQTSVSYLGHKIDQQGSQAPLVNKLKQSYRALDRKMYLI